jgi:diaminopimelate epimerase
LTRQVRFLPNPIEMVHLMNPIPFFKMSGCGNDFIVIDNRSGIFGKTDPTAFVRDVCLRKMSIGADGLILIEDSDAADFQWRFFNSDGSRAEMCGNGARCAARFAHIHNIAGEQMTFVTDAGRIDASICGTGVKIRLTDPSPVEDGIDLDVGDESLTVTTVNTGVPHVVISVPDAGAFDLGTMGPKIRFHEQFAPAGTNANVMSPAEDNMIIVRTYERGVEDETLACGTGAVACALAAARQMGMDSPIRAHTKSGSVLTIYFARNGEQFADLFLEGDARVICRGEVLEEAYGYLAN